MSVTSRLGAAIGVCVQLLPWISVNVMSELNSLKLVAGQSMSPAGLNWTTELAT